MIKKSIRELEKEIRSLETNEKKLIADIKKHAKLNQMVCFVCICSLMISYPLLEFSENYGEGFGTDS